MNIITKQIFILFVFVVSGFLLSKKKILDSSHSNLLSVLIIYIFLPSKIFNTFSHNLTLSYLKEKYNLLIVSLAVLLIVIIIATILSKCFSTIPYERCIYWHAMIVPNISYFGYVLADALYGQETLLNVMIFSLPILLFNYTLGYCILTKTPIHIKILLKPTIIAVIAGSILGLSNIPIPDILSDITSKASACVGPASMILTGIVISEYKLKRLIKNPKAYFISILRLIVLPIVIASVLKYFFTADMILAVLLIYAMPCPMNTIVFARSVNENCEIGAGLVFISTAISIITIPIMIHFLV